MESLCSNYNHKQKWHHKRCCLIIVLYRTIINSRRRGIILRMCMPLSNIETSLFGLLVIFFNKTISYCCISLTATTSVTFNTRWRDLTDSVTIITNQ